MTDDSGPLRRALKSVIDAHEVLAQFHKEVGALFRIVDEELADPATEIRFEALYPQYIVRDIPTLLRAPEGWVSEWLGRFYVRIVDDPTVAAAQEPAALCFRSAFLWIAERAEPKMAAGFALPECWFGVADAGWGSKAKNDWDAARYGFWQLDTTKVAPGDQWSRGDFPANTGKFGEGAFFWARRVPLDRLLGEEQVRTLVTNPLRDKYAEVFPEDIRKE